MSATETSLRFVDAGDCYSARKFDPTEACDIKSLACRSASNPRAEQQAGKADTGSRDDSDDVERQSGDFITIHGDCLEREEVFHASGMEK